jgi:hypothetical protein
VDGRPALEVADVIRAHGADLLAVYGDVLSAAQRRVLRDLAACRTAALGGHVQACDRCGAQPIAYNSCRNRHCPKCAGSQAARWLEREAAALLPVAYHHVVFTLPAALAPLALQNPRVVYGLLFRASQATLQEVAANPKHLGAAVGGVAVLHTWGQNLHHHPHVHGIVTGGGLSCDRAGVLDPSPRWVSCRPGFFLPVRVLSRLFRGQFLAGLRRAWEAGQLVCAGALAGLAAAGAFGRWLAPLYEREWVVYSKPPFGGPEQVLKYLARYTHRVALSNRRLLALADGVVSFRAKDYAQGGRSQVLRLPAVEFLRRFLQHVLPRGFVKVRHYGLLANRRRDELLARSRWLLGVAHVEQAAALPSSVSAAVSEPRRCPVCGVGRLRVVRELPRGLAEPVAVVTVVAAGCDSS